MTFNKIILGTAISSMAIATLIGCQSINQKTTTDAPMLQKPMLQKPILQEEVKFDNPFQQSNTMNEQLQKYNWQLSNAVDGNHKTITELTKNTRPVILSFTQNIIGNNVSHNIGFSVGCNSMGAGYQLNDNKLALDTIISTQMFCEEMNSAESKLANLMSGNSKLSLNNDALSQITADGSMLTWQGTLTDDAKYGKGETIFLEIAPQMEYCSSGINQQCLKVREVYYNDNGTKRNTSEWTLMKQPIKGYSHDPKTSNVLRVKKYIHDAVDIKGKQLIYILDMVVESGIVE